jgi:hypothetical protein
MYSYYLMSYLILNYLTLILGSNDELIQPILPRKIRFYLKKNDEILLNCTPTPINNEFSLDLKINWLTSSNRISLFRYGQDDFIKKYIHEILDEKFNITCLLSNNKYQIQRTFLIATDFSYIKRPNVPYIFNIRNSDLWIQIVYFTLVFLLGFFCFLTVIIFCTQYLSDIIPNAIEKHTLRVLTSNSKLINDTQFI